MIIIIGLGNPGKKFEMTWHNLGFLTLKIFQEKNNFPAFKFEKNFPAEISKGKLENEEILLVKPHTFMNDSGKAVKKIISYYKSPIPNLWVVHDDLDISLGKIRISKNRGSAGHKGVQSIIDNLRTKNFVRFRIGIQSKEKYNMSSSPIEKFVLEKFKKREEKDVEKIIQKTSKAIETAIKEGIEKAMSKFNV